MPCIAASVKPSELATFELGAPTLYKACRCATCRPTSTSRSQALPTFESVESISYDDDARTGDRFSFAQVNEPMEVIMHVGPEYSWDVLEKFLEESQGRLVSAMYEFHARAHQGRDRGAAEQRRRPAAGRSTTPRLPRPTESFDRVAVFEDWAERFQFTRIVAPEGTTGLISDCVSHQGHGAGRRHVLAVVRQLEGGIEPAGHHAGAARQRDRPKTCPAIANGTW